MKNKICIFGANSIIAEKFISLYSEKFEMICIARKKLYSAKDKKVYKNILFDISKENNSRNNIILSEKLKESNSQIKNIFILYSWAGGPRSSKSNEGKLIWEANERIISNFVEICENSKPSHVIFLSSAGAIYDPNCELEGLENSKTNYSSPYGEQKLFCEKLLLVLSKKINFNLTILRVSTAYGFDPKFSDQGVLNKWLFSAKNNLKIVLYNSLDSFVNFISFDQIAQATNIVIEKNIFGLFNIGSKESTSLNQILEIVKKVSKNKNLEIVYKNQTKRLFKLNTSLFKASSGLNFEDNLYIEALKIYDNI